MGLTGSVVSFLLVWWVVLFVVLPMRVRSVWEDDAAEGNHPEGADKGAPVNPDLLQKAKLTTLIAIPVWFVIFLVVTFVPITYDR